MADVANCMKSSTPTKTHMGQMIPDSPDPVVLSPGVKEAMDRIFPRSATQLLQGGLSFGEDSLFGVASLRTNKDTTQPRNSSVAASCADIVNLHSKPPHVSTLSTSDTAMAASLGFMHSPTRNGPPFVSSSLSLTTDTAAHPEQAVSFDNGKDRVKSNGKPLEVHKSVQSKNRISKADFEIVTSCDALINEYERTSRRINCVDISSSECHSRDASDSEDMRRPFATIAREKKRRKRKKKETDVNSDKASGCLSQHYVNSEDEFQPSKSWGTSDMSASIRDFDNGKVEPQTDFVSRTNTVIQNTYQELPSCAAFIKKSTLGFSENTKDNNSHVVFGSGSEKDVLYKDYGTTNEDISNISYSSSKENVHGQKRTCRQKLPKSKRQHYHIVKHINKIRNTFPPCFVVVEKTNNFDFLNSTKYFNTAANVLPLSVRVKNLADLCDKGTLLCRKNKKIAAAEELMFKNIFTEAPYLGITDDDFEKPRVRSLRKRDKHISYVEPSEDDILVEFSKKNSRRKNNDSQLGKSGDESSSDSKKRKKQDSSKKKSSASAHLDGSKDKAVGIDQSRSDYEQDQRFANFDDRKGIIAFPNTNYSNSHPYYDRTDGVGMIPFSVAEKPQHMFYSQDPGTNISMMPSPSHISILANSSMPGGFPYHTGPVSLFPPLPPNFQGLPSAQPPFIRGTPTSCQVPTSTGAQGPPQFYVVKMNGKDVLLRFVPSAGIGAPPLPSAGIGAPLPTPGIGAPLPMTLPKGSPFYTPPGHMLSQPIGQPHPSAACTQAMLRPITSIAPAAHSNSASSSSFQSLYGMPMLNRAGHTSSHMSMPVPPAHLGYGSTAGMMSMTSGTHVSHGSAASLPLPPPPQLTTAPSHSAGHINNHGIRLLPLTSGAYASHSSSDSQSVPTPAQLAAPSHLSGHASNDSIRHMPLKSGIYSSHSSSISQPVPITAHFSASPSHHISHVSTAGTRPISLITSSTSHSLVTGLSGHVFSSKTAVTSAATKSVASSILSTQPTPALASMLSPNTTIVRSTQAPGSSLQETPTSQSATVRIFVPGCSAMGTPGRFATFGSLANTSPLTRLSANSSLLPQCNRSSEPDLSPEQHAAKRRKLEKRYPLPPGVVIKTEPLDEPPKPAPTITSRSLLSSNIQLLSSTRPGSGVQRFRIISPSLATALSLRNVSGGSEIVYRTASVGGGQTVLVQASLGGLLSTTMASTPLTVTSSAAANVAKATTVSSTNHNSPSTGSSSVITEALSSPCRDSSDSPRILSPQLYSPAPANNTSAIHPVSLSSVDTIFEPGTSVNEPARSSSSLRAASAELSASSNVSTISWSNNNTQLPPSNTPPVAPCLDNSRASLEQLRKIIQLQASLGLKGERLDKLKELLHRKEQYYSDLQRLVDARAASEFHDNQTCLYNNDSNREAADGVYENGASETNPFVID